jgi:hypothetical protein
VKQNSIKAGDLLLLWSPCMEASGKLEPKWVRPFLIVEKIRPGSFHLAYTEGKALQHS